MPIPDIRIAVKLLKNFIIGESDPKILEQAASIIYANDIKPLYVVNAIRNLLDPPEEGGEAYAQEYINQQLEDIVRSLNRRKTGAY
jgi:hypothetical protein